MSQHHIVMIIDGLPGGGAEKVVITLSQGLLALGHRVSLLSLRDVCNYTLPEGIDYRVITDTSRSPWRKLTELSRRAGQLDKVFRKLVSEHGSVDLVVSHLHKTDRIVRRSKAIDPQKTWFCLHGVFSRSYLGHRTGLSRWLKAKKIHRVYQQRNIIGVSRYVADDLCQHFSVNPVKQQVIANPFDFDAILAQATEPVPLPEKSYLLHVGRFHEVKRHDRLLKAYALSDLTWPLVLLGEGSTERTEQLKQLARELHISERVIFEGFHSNPYSWIKNARMLILSSDSEGFGNVLVEALICETQVVSTRCPGGPPEILTGNLAAGLADLTAESLAATMQQTDRHPVNIDPQVVSNYQLDTICYRYLNLITTGNTDN